MQCRLQGVLILSFKEDLHFYSRDGRVFGIFSSNYDNLMSHHVPGPPDYDVVMTEQVSGLNGPKMLGRHKPTAPKY